MDGRGILHVRLLVCLTACGVSGDAAEKIFSLLKATQQDSAFQDHLELNLHNVAV